MFYLASLTLFASLFSATTSLPPPTMETSENLMEHHTEEPLTYSPVAFPASLFPQPGREEEQQTTVSSGRRCYESYEKSSQHGLLLRTCVASLLLTTEWYSSVCVLNWKRMNTKSSRFVFQLAPSVRRTSGKESGLLLTPRASEGETNKETFRNRMGDHPNSYPSLTAQINALLPTPQTMDAQDNTTMGKGKVVGNRVVRESGQDFSIKLKDRIEMLPTPSASVANDGESIESWERRKQKNLAKHNNGNGMGTPLTIAVGKSTGYKLQPAFVGYMMGFPVGWNEIYK
jgi:hypothetical protein